MGELGHNSGFIDELYASYRADPTSVSEAWREFFRDWRPEPAVERPPAPAPEAPSAAAGGPARVELRGAAARIAENMTASLDVPTATSARTIPVKVLEENRRLINQHQATTSGPRISFTQLVAWALVRALERHPRMNARYVALDGRPHREQPAAVNLGLAVDVERNGERVLLVPNVKGSERLDFAAFLAIHDDLVARARSGRLTPEDFADTTLTLTNPGTLGTALSVPRLMPGQGTIVGVGRIGYPAECAGMSAERIADLGLSRGMTLTSTYDHRVIQGAESGAFLATIERLLLGEEGFYAALFAALRVPHEPVRWAADSGATPAAAAASEAQAKQAGVAQLVRCFRVRGHLLADLDPLGYVHEPIPELEPATYGLTVWDLDRRFVATGLAGPQGTLPLREILETLEQTYCGHVGVEYMHIQDPRPRHWLQARMERTRNSEPLSRDWQLRILGRLNAAEAFETFLGTTYVGQKRFSLEGAETLIPLLDALLHDAAASGQEEVVIGMAHRGRLNVLAHVVGKSYGQIFREFEGDIDPQTTHGSGDVKYHLGASGLHAEPGVGEVRVSVASNPSHLEAVDPVVEGIVRARQDCRGDLARERVLPVLIHGDAAFSGQGVVAETLNLSQLRGYHTGGTVHIVVNNQIGFTTGPADLRSSPYPTDVAKGVQAPIFHVNGDHPDAAVRVIRLALDFRRTFKSDVVVDLVCYRRWGHNEADDPSFTHPILYAKIQHHRSVRKLYTERLLRSGELDPESAERALADFKTRLTQVHAEVRQAQTDASVVPWRGDTTELEHAVPRRATAPVAAATLSRIVAGSLAAPEGFTIHPKLAQQHARRREQFAAGSIDWSLAETLAFGSLVLEGKRVRLSGEDSSRGTFSQRHATLVDHRTARPWVPLAHLDPAQAPFEVFDSLLSEFAVLGFEYGYSVANPDALVLWEAQFGDFDNGAQVIIDQFVASAADKWGQRGGVVLLLPHGHEGQGPEHSSARPERFLQLAARGNLQVVQPTLPAQYFHLLRSHAHAQECTPLVVLTPKSLLRHRACVSQVADLTTGGFRAVLEDPLPASGPVERLLLCSGKVFFDLDEARHAQGRHGVALVRLEQLYPFPADDLARLLAAAGQAEVVWVQEEPQNMGAWTFIRERLTPLLGARTLGYAGRPRAASPATGSHKRHTSEQEGLIAQALGSGAAADAGQVVAGPARG